MNNNIRLEITKKVLELETIKNNYRLKKIEMKDNIICIDPGCCNHIEKEHFLTKVNNYHYIFCSRKCWNKYLYNRDNINYNAQFTHNTDYNIFLEKLTRKNREYCFNYSRDNYCFIGL